MGKPQKPDPIGQDWRDHGKQKRGVPSPALLPHLRRTVGLATVSARSNMACTCGRRL